MNRTLISASLLAVLTLTACSRQEPPPAPERPVKLMTVGHGDVAGSLEFAGDVRARVESGLGFRVSGKIMARLVEAGQRVHKGQELARLDPRDFQLADEAAGAQLISAQAQRDNARAEFKRYEELAKKGYVSQTDLDRKRVELTAAEAQYNQATSNQSLEKNRVEDTILRADADGVVVAIKADVGEVVTAGQPVVQLAQEGIREIEVEFPEDRMAMARHARAEVTLWAHPGARYPASLRELAAAADPVTRTFRARYTVKAPANALALGQSAVLHLQLPATRTGLSRLPTTAIFGKQGATQVFVFDEKTSTVHQQPVQIGGADGNDVLVAGLKPGTQVVMAGTQVLADGQKVKRFVPTAKH